MNLSVFGRPNLAQNPVTLMAEKIQLARLSDELDPVVVQLVGTFIATCITAPRFHPIKA